MKNRWLWKLKIAYVVFTSQQITIMLMFCIIMRWAFDATHLLNYRELYKNYDSMGFHVRSWKLREGRSWCGIKRCGSPIFCKCEDEAWPANSSQTGSILRKGKCKWYQIGRQILSKFLSNYQLEMFDVFEKKIKNKTIRAGVRRICPFNNVMTGQTEALSKLALMNDPVWSIKSVSQLN